MAFGFLTLSYIVFLFTDEPHMPKPPREAHHSFKGQFGRMRMILREDGEFRTYLMARILGTTVFATVPYMAVTALEVTGRPDAFTGRLLAFQMSGAILGNLLGGWLGDTLGSRRVLISARSSFMLSCACLLLLPTALGFCLAFLLWGMTRAQQVIGEQTFLVEISKGRPMPAYVGIASLAQLLSVLAMAGISLQLRKWFPGILPVALFSLAGMVGSAWLLKTRVREPRGSR